MAFNSPEYLIFLIVSVILFYLMPRNQRKWLLLLAGYVFIGSYNFSSLLVLIGFTTFNFYYGSFLHHKTGSATRKKVLWVGLVINCFALLFFKYFERATLGGEFAISSVNFKLDSLLVAVGFSFYTLQNIAYLLDIYHKKQAPEHNWLDFSLFTGFFAKLPMGPIMVAKEFIPGIKAIPEKYQEKNIIYGIQRIALGLFKKMVIADRLAPSVGSIFDHADTNVGFCALVSSYLFVLQLYFDFSGSMDIALGSARLFGIKLKENFNLPLRATSISDFWRRWHISLIDWLTNYLYYPIVFRLRKLKKRGLILGIAVIFLLSGLWHGIGWTFTLYAVCHLVYMIFEVFTKQIRLKWSKTIPDFIYRPLSIFMVFNLVSFSFIFFRASSLTHLKGMLSELFTGKFWPTNWTSELLAPLAEGGEQEPLFNLYLSIAMVVLALVFEKVLHRFGTSEQLNIVFLFLLIMLIAVYGIFDAGTRFIYIQF